MIIFFYGENDFKISQKIKELEEKFVREVDTSGQNIFKFDGEKIKLEEIAGQIASGSLFSNKKMVLIFDLIKNKQKNIFLCLQLSSYSLLLITGWGFYPESEQ